ncbi:uncharacterized protein LOC143207183 [Lasioglossum baleicum]|uniref:uncharacterized protein LOC143207183 n=1 Tax=Lasioglossum baleicum TaxID=434251 RepID=UPI003FCCA1C2
MGSLWITVREKNWAESSRIAALHTSREMLENECRKFLKISHKNWSFSLGRRNSLLRYDIPYIPILVEDISIHCSSEDYQENGVKTIQTLGELVPKTETSATLISLTLGNNSEIPIYFNNLSISDIYMKDSNSSRYAIWKKYTVFKVYGSLTLMGSEHVLETINLVPVHDIVGTWNTMSLLSATARSKNHRYSRTEAQNKMLRSQWKKMKLEKKRLV